jgi:hypothetical protein
MNYQKVLSRLESNELTPELAYKELYRSKKAKPGKRATFIKLSIKVPEEGKGINTFLRILFALPIPLVLARWGLRFASRFTEFDEENDLNVDEILHYIKYSKGTRVSVDSNDAKIDIKII